MNGDYLASCYGKIRYPNYKAAKAAAESVGSILTPYKCRYIKEGVHYHKGKKGKS